MKITDSNSQMEVEKIVSLKDEGSSDSSFSSNICGQSGPKRAAGTASPLHCETHTCIQTIHN